MDHRLIGLYVARLVEPRMTWDELAAASGVHRSTLYRLRDGDPHVSHKILRRVEPALSLLYDTLTTVGFHDWLSLETDYGIDGEMIAWLRRQAGKSTTATTEERERG